jgi:hypothetical protein
MQLGFVVESDPISFSLASKAIGSSDTNQTHALGLAAKLDLNVIGSSNRAIANNKKY